ncbi:MAG: hypothetical protein LRY28_05480 [Erysipelotrichaceae bacterium]|nr:hypothetical protein [Erysipelotrichaceae bacterium]
MADVIVAALVISINGGILWILWRRHKKKKSVCARCMSTQSNPSWMNEYHKERLK